MISGAGPIGKHFSVGAGIFYFDGGTGVQTFDDFGNFGGTGGTFVHAQGLAGIGLGAEFGLWSLGISLLEGFTSSDVVAGQAPDFSLGMALWTEGGVRAGASLRGAGWPLAGRPLPHEGTLGFALDKIISPDFQLTTVVEGQVRFAASPKGSVGFELGYKRGTQRFAFRGGLRLAEKTGGLPISTGMSVGRRLGKDTVMWLDYAYESSGVLGSIHRVGFRTSYEKMPDPPVAWLEAPASFVAERQVARFALSTEGGARIQRWELILTKFDGSPAAHWHGTKRPPPEISWSGENAVEGLYEAELILVDELGRASRSVIRSVRLVRDSKPSPPPEEPQVFWEVVYTIPSDVLYTSGSHVLRVEAEVELEKVIQSLVLNHKGSKIHVDGHTDNVNLRSGSIYRDNRELSQKRAGEVKGILARRLGYDDDLISVWGYGTSRPVADNKLKLGRSRNRRVEISVVTGQTFPLSRALVLAASADASGNMAQALSLLRLALDVAPNHAEVHRQMGSLLYRLGARQRGLGHLEKCLELRPEDEELRIWLQRAGGAAEGTQ